jgi:pimeloyl-ACP methyl ester carboxylesterase
MKFQRLRRLDFARDGLTLAAYDSGGDGLPVVFQHGLCGDARQTAEAFPDDPRFRLITLECRGHGQSQAGSAFSIATLAEDVAGLIDHLALGPVVLGGISMGAAIASRLAVYRPDLARGLILARPAWATAAAPANMRPNLEIGELLARFGNVPPPLTPLHRGEGEFSSRTGDKLSAPRKNDDAQSPPPPCGEGLGVGVNAGPIASAKAAFLESDTYARLAREAPDNVASLLGFFEREPIAVTSALLRSISVDGPGIAETDLTSLSLPTLVLATEKDAIHPLALAEQLARLIPGAHLVRMTPKGVDKPAYLADFHAALSTFLKDF